MDEKIWEAIKFLQTGSNIIPYRLYPRVYEVSDAVSSSEQQLWGFTAEGSELMMKPKTLVASHQAFSNRGAYIIDNGIFIYLYICSQVSEEFVYEVFGYDSLAHLRQEQVASFEPIETEASQKIWNLVE